MSLANRSVTRSIAGFPVLIGRLGEKELVVPRAGRRDKAFPLSHEWRGSWKPVVEALREAVAPVFEDSPG